MKTVRLLYPDYASGGLPTYYLGAKLLEQIVPANPDQKTLQVAVTPPSDAPHTLEDGIQDKAKVVSEITDAQRQLQVENPERVITLGGNCMVSFAPFDYLHGKYPDMGLLWIDAHPDVSTPANGYPCAHAMVLGSLLGDGAKTISALRQNPPFAPERLMYVGLQDLHDYQKAYLDQKGVHYEVNADWSTRLESIQAFVSQFKHLAVHFDIDVLDERYFHDTYFANLDLVGDGAHGGRMRLETLAKILATVEANTKVVGFTIAEYLPHDAYRLHQLFSHLTVFRD